MAQRAIISGSNHEGVITQLREGADEDMVWAPLGAEDTNIKMHDSNDIEWGTLHDFFKEWEAFKVTWNDFITNAKFMQYGTVTPNSENIKLLFEVKGE